MPLQLITPPRLKQGDTVAAISTSWGGAHIFPHRYETGKKQFEQAFGVKVVETPHALCPDKLLWRDPKSRADDLNEAIRNPKIKAIISTIGGDDCIRLLPYIDYKALRQNPKIFMGYSDPTAIHFAFLKAGIQSYYGPAFMTTFAENCGIFDYVIESVKRHLFDDLESYELKPSLEWTDEKIDWVFPDNQKRKRQRITNSGALFFNGKKTIRGHLIGGCLEVLEMIKGTPVWPTLTQWTGAILFIDLSEEAPAPEYVTRCFRNYHAAGILNKIKGILVGRPCNVSIADFDRYDQAIKKAVYDEAGLSMPIVTRMDFGHTDPMTVLPYGATVEINPVSKTVKFV